MSCLLLVAGLRLSVHRMVLIDDNEVDVDAAIPSYHDGDSLENTVWFCRSKTAAWSRVRTTNR